MSVVLHILLGLLILILLLVLLLLFWPIRYRIRGSCHEGRLTLRGSVYAIVHLLGAGICIREGWMQSYLRILGIKIPVGGMHHNSAKNEDTIPQEPTDNKAAGHIPKAQMPEFSESTESKKTESSPERFAKIRAFFHRVPEICSHLVLMAKNGKTTMQKFAAFAGEESNRRALSTVWGKVRTLLSLLMPRKLRLTMQYSTGSPDTTGQLLGILAMFPLGYQNRWKIQPDFTADNAYVETDFDVRGSLFGIQLLKLLFEIILDKDCQKLYNKIS